MDENIESNQKTVLVVDDEIAIVELLKHHLTLEGYNVLEANDGIKLAEKEMDNSNVKRLKNLLKDNEKQKSNLLEKLKLCDIDCVAKAIFAEIEKMENEHKQIEAEITREENRYNKLTIPKIKFFLLFLSIFARSHSVIFSV